MLTLDISKGWTILLRNTSGPNNVDIHNKLNYVKLVYRFYKNTSPIKPKTKHKIHKLHFHIHIPKKRLRGTNSEMRWMLSGKDNHQVPVDYRRDVVIAMVSAITVKITLSPTRAGMVMRKLQGRIKYWLEIKIRNVILNVGFSRSIETMLRVGILWAN